MQDHDIYAYGMTVLSTIHLLGGAYPAANGYAEIKETFVMPGGEVANSAIVLAGFGLRVVLDGCYLGQKTCRAVSEYLQERGIDSSLMTELPGFAGWSDLVLCDGVARTVFGWYGALMSGGRRLWTVPSEEAIRRARCVVLDPFFGKESALVAELCMKHGVGYVTADCRIENPIGQNAQGLICCGDFLDREYPGIERGDVLERYRAACKGLVIFTAGAGSILYASPQTERAEVPPYRIEVVDTLAAGDAFRAGLVYALLNGMEEEKAVRFAAATAAVVCTRFPSVHEPPTVEEVGRMMGRGE